MEKIVKSTDICYQCPSKSAHSSDWVMRLHLDLLISPREAVIRKKHTINFFFYKFYESMGTKCWEFWLFTIYFLLEVSGSTNEGDFSC